MAPIGERVKDFKLVDFYSSWEGCLSRGLRKIKAQTSWPPPPFGTYKINVHGAAGEKPQSTGIGGVLRDCNGKPSIVFSKPEDKGTQMGQNLLVLGELCLRGLH